MPFDLNDFEREVERFRYDLVHAGDWNDRLLIIESYNKKIHKTLEVLREDENEPFAMMRCAYVASGIASLLDFFYSFNGEERTPFAVLYDNYNSLIGSVKSGETPKEKALVSLGSSLFVTNELNTENQNAFFDNKVVFDNIVQKVPDIKKITKTLCDLSVSVADAKNSGFRPHKMHEYGDIVMKNLDNGKLENYRDALKTLTKEERIYYIKYIPWFFKSENMFKKAKEIIETGKGNFAYSAMFDDNEKIPYITTYVYSIITGDMLDELRIIFEVPRPEVHEDKEASVDVKDMLNNVFQKGQSK